jgi:hypothetical protein
MVSLIIQKKQEATKEDAPLSVHLFKMNRYGAKAGFLRQHFSVVLSLLPKENRSLYAIRACSASRPALSSRRQSASGFSEKTKGESGEKRSAVQL